MSIRLLSTGCLLIVSVFTGFAAGQDHAKPKVILEWRSELIRSLAFTSDGKQLVVSPKDNDVWVFNAETGAKLENDIKGLRGPTNFLLPGPRPGTIYCFEKLVSRLVDTNTGKELSASGISIDYSPSGMFSAKKNVLALAAHAGGVELLSADLQKSEVSFEPKDPPPQNPKDWRACAAAYSPDGKFVAGARPNGRLYLYVTSGFKEASQQAVSAHAGKIEALAFTPGELLSLGIDGKLKRWSTPDAKELAAYSFPSALDRGWLLANGQVAATVSKPVDGELKFFQVPVKEGDELKLVATIPIVTLFDGFPTVHREFSVPQIALSPDGQRLALAGMAGSNDLAITRIAIYDVSSFMPKLAVASATESDPRVTGSGVRQPLTKTTPAPMPKTEREFREWNTADGMFKVEAQFVGKTGDNIRLKRKDNGKVITVPLEKFSEEDQAYVRGLR
jgi:WD40 repeat protein